MKMKTKLLLTVGLSAGLLSFAHQGFAMGPGGPGAGMSPYKFNLQDMGPLSGDWTFTGGVDGWGGLWNAASPSNPGLAPYPGTGSHSYGIGEAVVMLQKTSGLVQFTYWGGAWQTPAMGLTSDWGAFNSVGRLGLAANPLPSTPTFKWWFTLQPSQYWSIQAGENPSLEGVEIGFDFLNPTFFVSDLNNMQATPAYGVQGNIMYGNSTFNLQWGDLYKTDRFNVISAAELYNLNADGSDYLLGFGHTVVGHTWDPSHGGYAPEINSSLVGAGAQWVVGPWTVVPEAEYQWLPKGSVTASNSVAAPTKTFYNVGAMVDVTYAFTPKWSLTVQPQYIYQNGNSNDPSYYSNWLQFGVPNGPGTFSGGTTMVGLQIDPTWQNKNFFIRPTLAYTHVSGYAAGTGYGKNGNSSDQIVGLVEAGFLIGSY